MSHRFLSSILVAFALATSAVATAAPRDAAANQKIEEAINTHYLATEFDKAEALLKGILDACEDRCSPGVKGRAWMYVGIVRGSGRQDMAGAQESFQQALALDPKVKLDDALATPAVRDAFAAAAAMVGAPAPAAGGGGGGGGGGEVPGGMECTPDVAEVEAQRPIPVACTTDEPAAKVTLRYMVFGGSEWSQVNMTKKGEYWQGEIPCADTGVTGRLKFYVQARDKDGEELDSFGSKKQPAEIAVVGTTDEEPPAYPGQPAPQKCMSASECPEDMIGTPACPSSGGKTRGGKGWGAPCDTSVECDAGLLCMQGDSGRTCETAPSCSADADCPSGSSCRGGTCDVSEEGGDEAAGPYKQNWFGLHLGADLAFIGGDGVCGADSDFDCFFAGGIPVSQRIVVQQNALPSVATGGAFGGVRALASYERLFTPNIGAEARLGFAFNGGPKAPGGASFLPVHLEVRGKYWFRKSGFSKRGLRPYVGLGGGVAQVDAKLAVKVYDCTARGPDGAALPGPNGEPLVGANPCPVGPPVVVDAYKRLGQAFITAGGGAMYAIAESHGVVLNLGLMYMLPSSGLVIEPTLGYQLGF